MELLKDVENPGIVNAVVDSSGFCSFMMINLDDLRGFYGAYFGEEVKREQIADMGWAILQDEWEFNRRAGFGPEHDVMPDCMKQDPIGPAKLVWDVPSEVVAQAYERFENSDELFQLRS